jgi:hypothetical protein
VMRHISAKGIVIKGNKGSDNSVIGYTVLDSREKV